MRYLKCPDCGIITRNLDCPVCRVKQIHKKETAALKVRRAYKISELSSLEEKTERLEKVLKQQARQLIKELKDLLYP
jgi:hypothetical protein